jgi:alpha-beta hydrolase superfamily lysophospholipase
MTDAVGSRSLTLLSALPALGLGLLGAAAVVGEYGRRQITRSLRTDFRDDPEPWGLGPAEEIALTARDGIRLHAWLFMAPQPAPSVVLCHGHGGNKHTLLPLAQVLHPHYNVFLLDSRGHGESGGDRTTIGYEERLDVHAAVDELIGRGLGPVGLLGISMGAAIAILAAAEDGRIAAIVADSPFARLRWAVAEVARMRGYPAWVTPPMAYLGVLATALRLRYPVRAFDPIEVVDRIAPRPLLLLHGEKDEVIGARHSRLLFERAGEPKELWVLSGLLHCRGLDDACDPYRERIQHFFDRWLARSSEDVGGARNASVVGRAPATRRA